jgi:flagellar hook protein FlgE
MLRSLNSGVSGLRAFQTKLDVIGNNIANVNTTGFKKGRVVFEDLFSQTVREAMGPTATSGGMNPLQVGLGTKVISVENLYSQGSPQTTNNPADIYINGDGFFVVQKGNDKYLTRAGNFTLDLQSRLVNPEGLVVLGKDGNGISLAGYVDYSIDTSGNVTGVRDDGTTQQVGTIGVATVANTSGLKKIGGSLYQISLNANDAALQIPDPNSATNYEIISGALEMSNVDLAEEMTEMITAQRGFQANSKVITTSDTILDELINLKR